MRRNVELVVGYGGIAGVEREERGLYQLEELRGSGQILQIFTYEANNQLRAKNRHDQLAIVGVFLFCAIGRPRTMCLGINRP